jgi:protein SCO1/2
MLKGARLAVVVTSALAGLCAATCDSAGARAQVIGSAGGAFELTDHNGKPFSSATLAGKPYALFFGYTNCPDICPTTLIEITNLLRRLGANADRLQVLFVTVDPEHDTPEHLRVYLESFDPRIVALTGSAEQIAAVAKAWKASYYMLPEDGGGYAVVHSAYVYLMDRDNRLADTFGFQEAEHAQLAKLEKLLAGSDK